MRQLSCASGILVTMALVLALSSACSLQPRTRTPTQPPQGSVPAPIVAARDAALSYLRHTYPQKAPPEGTPWQAQNTTPQGVVGNSSYSFKASPWDMIVSAPVVAPDLTLYETELWNESAGTHWTGRLGSTFAILESNLDVSAEAISVRDLALRYLRSTNPDLAPPPDLAWVGERTTAEGSVSHESCRFASGDWLMTVDYDVVLPDQMTYQVELRGGKTVWRGQIDAEGVVLQHR